MSPLVATTLIRETGRPTAPAVLAAGTALITLIGSSWLGRYGGQVLGRTASAKDAVAS
jgi:hypothetical protein